MTTLEIQRALKLRGFDPGPLDGILGRRTIAAIKAFQKAKGLDVDGIVGPITRAVLAGVPAAKPMTSRPPWYVEGERHMGLREVAGAKHNPTILGWLEKLRAAWRDDETAWCGTYVGWCIAATLPEEPLPGNPFGARNWLLFGRGIERPALGAIAVFWRGSRAGWQGHVGFVAGEDTSAIHVLGGNQSNSVNIARLGRDRLLGYRWPKTYPLPSGGVVTLSTGSNLSTNEA